MTDGPIVIKISIRHGISKPHSAQQTFTEKFCEQATEDLVKKVAIDYFAQTFEKSRKKKKRQPKLRLVKE